MDEATLLTQRSAVDVTWTATDKTMKCRLGHEGKVRYIHVHVNCTSNVYTVNAYEQVDLKYITSSMAGYYYPDHLPVLGIPLDCMTCIEVVVNFIFLATQLDS